MKSIIYVCPTNKDKPSGGVKIIYRHSEILNKLKPGTLGQASRITGMTPAAITILRVYLRTKQAA